MYETALRNLEAVFTNGFYLTRDNLDVLLQQRETYVQSIHKLLPTALEPLDGVGVITDEGTWQETIEETNVDRLSYRHRRLYDGRRLIEERYTAVRANHRGLQHHTSRLWITPDNLLMRGEMVVESFVGEKTWTVEQSEQGGYCILQRDLDGHESLFHVGTEALTPGEGWIMTLTPSLLASQKEDEKEIEIPALISSAFGPLVVSMKLSRISEVDLESDEDATGPGVSWKVVVERPGSSTTHFYHLASDGTFVGMNEGGAVWIPVHTDETDL